MFKKNLFRVTMIATAMSGAMVLSSCSHDDITYSQEEVQQAKHAQNVAKYEQSFIKMFGQPAANQSWDFTKGGVLASTRGKKVDDNSLIAWPSNSAYVYGIDYKYVVGKKDDPLQENILNDLFNNHGSEIFNAINTTEPQEWSPSGSYLFRTFATVNSGSTGSDKYYSIGANFNGSNYVLAQEMHKKKEKNNNKKRGTTGSQHSCFIDFDETPNPHVWFACNTTGSSSSITASSNILEDFVDVELYGYHFWGFKCEEDGQYTDLILITLGIEETVKLKIAKRYMVEDLGGSAESDIDFNDIVFDVLQYSDDSQKCIVRALGGTLPIKIKVGNSDWWSKPEPVSKMINTQGTIDEDMVIAEFEVTGWNESSNNVQVMVEDKEGYEFVTTFPQNGKIPAMIAFSTIKEWNQERVPVTFDWFSLYPFNFEEE